MFGLHPSLFQDPVASLQLLAILLTAAYIAKLLFFELPAIDEEFSAQCKRNRSSEAVSHPVRLVRSFDVGIVVRQAKRSLSTQNL